MLLNCINLHSANMKVGSRESTTCVFGALDKENVHSRLYLYASEEEAEICSHVKQGIGSKSHGKIYKCTEQSNDNRATSNFEEWRTDYNRDGLKLG